MYTKSPELIDEAIIYIYIYTHTILYHTIRYDTIRYDTII